MEEQIDVLVSSPYRRAIETIQHLAEALNKNVIIEEDLRERKLSDTAFDLYQLYEAKRKVLEEPSFSFPGGESTLEVQKRAIPIITRLLQEYRGKNIAVATHGDIMTVMMNYYDKKYDYHFWENTTRPDIYRLQFDEKMNLAGVTRLWKLCSE
jgi:2,3-bisphosphoglycerate-dependent phosphoglycerate mutase